MVNIKKYDSDNPRVFVSTRLKTKEQLDLLYPELNTSHKKLKRLIESATDRDR